MPNALRDLTGTFVDEGNSLIFEKNVSIPLAADGTVIRCNVYRPQAEGKYPVLVTYGPYGKDIYYGEYVASACLCMPILTCDPASTPSPIPRSTPSISPNMLPGKRRSLYSGLHGGMSL